MSALGNELMRRIFEEWMQQQPAYRGALSASAAFAAGQAAMRERVRRLEEVLRMGVEWNDDYMRINNIYGKVEWVEQARALLAAAPAKEEA